MRVAVFGASGMLGRALVDAAPQEVECLALTRRDADLTDFARLAEVLRALRPAVLLNAAAYTEVDRAEEDEAAAFRVNDGAVGRLGELAADLGGRVVHFSTDYVFDGTAAAPYDEAAPRAPNNVYGRSKAAGEDALRASGASHLILRTQWLFGPNGRSFPALMWERARSRMPTRVVADQIGRPTYTVDLARTTWDLVRRGEVGTLHVANAGVASWHDLAAAVFERAGALECLSPCATADFPRPARRPSYSVLATDRLRVVLGRDLPTWQDALDRFLLTLASPPMSEPPRADV